MKYSKLFFLFLIISIPLLMSSSNQSDYVVLSWNDLGMHCANKDFSSIAVLPPYNNLLAQVIEKGNAEKMPRIIDENITITYEVPGNTYSVGKTNFWDYDEDLFGVNLEPNIGLTGKGLSGEMDIMTGYYTAEGIPLTPYTDADLNNEDPFQLALVQVYDVDNNLIGSSTPVIPVSNEINCVSSGCHPSEQQILNEHEDEDGFNPNNKPILCAECHASNALGTTGKGEAPIFSYVIHKEHAEKTSDCYKCHPGPKTKCLRGVMSQKGMTCTDCHGSMTNVANTIKQGRRPWLDEPSCGAAECHGSNYAENDGKLFRQSKGHGGVFCSGCHGEPHAIVPAREGTRDNVQNVALQGYEGVLNDCKVCHTVVPDSPGPHNFLPSSVEVINENLNNSLEINNIYPNPIIAEAKIDFTISTQGYTHLDIYDENGKHILSLINQYLLPAKYSVDINSKHLNNGMYLCVLKVGKKVSSNKFIVKK